MNDAGFGQKNDPKQVTAVVEAKRRRPLAVSEASPTEGAARDRRVRVARESRFEGDVR